MSDALAPPRAIGVFIAFVALLRANGFAVAPEQTMAFLAAIELLGPRSLEHIRKAGLATLAPPCGVRAIALRALDRAGIAWNEAFIGGGTMAVAAAALAGLAVAPLARRIAPAGLVDIGPALGLPSLGASKVMLHSRVSDPAKRAALRTLAATFRSAAG